MQRHFDKVVEFCKKKNVKTVLEIGGIRSLDYNYVVGDGHATVHWINNFEEVYSYDIEPRVKELTLFATAYSEKLTAETKDGVLAIKEFPKQIDLLYLDAWDVIPGTDYKEKHLEAFQAAEEKLHDNSVILIDDMEHGENGKGGLVIPYALTKGWKRMDIGKQAILYK